MRNTSGRFHVLARTLPPGPWDRGYESANLTSLVGAEGQQWLLSYLSTVPLIETSGARGVADLDRWVDIFRRLQTPLYEEARRRFGTEEARDHLDGANEIYPYLPGTLNRIADLPHDQD